MHFADSIVIFVLALILFGPKKLPEIARKIGKLMVEFRRASNEFKSQIDEELRVMEQNDRQKKLEAAAEQAPVVAAPEGATPAGTPSEEASQQPVILPPSTGETVSASRPHMPVAPPEMLEAASADPHPAYAEALASEKRENGAHAESEPENAQATVNHG
jgi:sec-independent protein translocase protein TatB